jgi:outer membrane lipoprotein SlyB
VFPYLRVCLPVVLLAALAGCGRDYSPNTYSTAAVQQANKVDQGVIAGFREVAIRSDGTVGAVAGGAAGGVLGAQAPEGGVITALSAIGGTLIGGIVGTTAEHVTDDTKGFEYVVRKTGGDLVAVTQKDQTPLAVGLKVLVIEGKQARVVADYLAPDVTPPPTAATAATKTDSKGETKGTDTAAKAEPPAKADPADMASRDGPANPSPAPALAPQPAEIVAPPNPVSATVDSTPAAPLAPPASAPSAAAPQAAEIPAPQTPSPAAEPQHAAPDPGPQPAPAEPDGSAQPAAPAQLPASEQTDPTH